MHNTRPMTLTTTAPAAALPRRSLLLLLLAAISIASSPAVATAASADVDATAPRRKNRRKKNHRHHTGKNKHEDEDEDALRERDLWQNPLWATPDTDLFWSAKEQPHHNDANWSANQQPPANSNNNNNNPRPPGNPFIKDNPPAQSQSRPSASNNYSYSRPPPSRPSSQSQPRPGGNPWDNPTKYSSSVGASPSSPTSSSTASAPQPSPTSSNNHNPVGGRGRPPTASALISSVQSGGSSNAASSSNTQQQLQQQQQVPTQPKLTATFTSTITLSNIPTTLPTYRTQQYTSFIHNLKARILSAIIIDVASQEGNANDQSSSLVQKITILSIGGVPVPTSRRHRYLKGILERSGKQQRSLQTTTQEVKYKAVLDYKCNTRTSSSCAENAQRLATSIANNLSTSNLYVPAPTPRPTRARAMPSPTTASNSYVDNRGEESFVWLPTPQANTVQVIPNPPTPRPTPRPVNQFVGDTTKRYCGFGWNDVIQNCLTATPCPGGDAFAVCPSGMNCIADTPCTDSTWLAQLAESSSPGTSSNGIVQTQKQGPSRPVPVHQQSVPMQSSNTLNGIMTMQFSPMAVSSSSSSSSNTISCTSDFDCRAYNQFCTVGGNCVECLPGSNIGCRASEVCAMSASSSGAPACVAGQDRQPQQHQLAQAMMYQNPPDNNYFCGVSYSAITGSCLQSKPCPSSAAWKDCGIGEGCFNHPTCKSQYDSAASMPSSMRYGAFADIEDILLDSQEESEEGVAGSTAGEAKSSFVTMAMWNSAPFYTTSSWQHLCLRWICSLSAAIVAGSFW
mmetsp:Transcript_16178/g.30519  ORF Transcript_16178/g.30519 Transcript_16178/m.30519 type:complete len:792 (+) Transcript_16178:126-2501(+)